MRFLASINGLRSPSSGLRRLVSLQPRQRLPAAMTAGDGGVLKDEIRPPFLARGWRKAGITQVAIFVNSTFHSFTHERATAPCSCSYPLQPGHFVRPLRPPTPPPPSHSHITSYTYTYTYTHCLSLSLSRAHACTLSLSLMRAHGSLCPSLVLIT